jgi:uncharacterized protein YraI
MKRSTLGLAAAVCGLVFAPNLASALTAVTTEPTNLRAGPAFDFPVVDSIPSEARVNVHGCVRGYRWCDVSWRDARGWMAGEELAYLYDGRRVTIVEYGPRIGLPVIGFAFDTYWDRYYRSRPWYSERTRWRTVWRDRERGDRRTGDRGKDRDKDRVDRRQDKDRVDRRQVDRTDRTREGSRRDVDRRQGDNRRSERRPDRDDRPNVRTGRGDWRDRGETRSYNPQTSPGVRQGTDRGDRGSRQGASPGGRPEPSMGGDRGSSGQGGGDRGGSRQGGGGGGDRRP